MSEIYGIELDNDIVRRLKESLFGESICEAAHCYEPGVIKHAGWIQVCFCDEHGKEFDRKAENVWDKYARCVQEV